MAVNRLIARNVTWTAANASSTSSTAIHWENLERHGAPHEEFEAAGAFEMAGRWELTFQSPNRLPTQNSNVGAQLLTDSLPPSMPACAPSIRDGAECTPLRAWSDAWKSP